MSGNGGSAAAVLCPLCLKSYGRLIDHLQLASTRFTISLPLLSLSRSSPVIICTLVLTILLTQNHNFVRKIRSMRGFGSTLHHQTYEEPKEITHGLQK
ncbi:hypothetical protein L208DRAFT_1387055 [Tricholoma matsutake]|nr:hypothetical protein L208DRAFT_1387055 [Tricholoma matsutake 945]